MICIIIHSVLLHPRGVCMVACLSGRVLLGKRRRELGGGGGGGGALRQGDALGQRLFPAAACLALLAAPRGGL
jgi:hypothetical protein